MKTTEILIYVINGSAAILGFFIGGYLGGIATGFCLTIIFLSIVGKRIMRNAFRRIDKSIKDRISESSPDL